MPRLSPHLLGTFLTVAAGASAHIPAPVDQLIQQLTNAGSEIAEVERTWLGRYRIEAVRGGFEREIVIDPRNGIILRDILEPDEDEDGDEETEEEGNEDDPEEEQEDAGGDDDDDDDEDDGDDDGDDGSDDD